MAKKVIVEKAVSSSNADIKKKIELAKGVLPKPAGINKFGVADMKSPAIVSPK